VEGLPGIGFVANIASLHLIRELRARCFCKIYSPYFQAMALTDDVGRVRPPMNEMYAAEVPSIEQDIIVLYGNTQSHSSKGQYEICDRILETVYEIGCRRVITIGGLKREEAVGSSSVYCAATDRETFEKAASLGGKLIQGRVFGAAGLLLGLAQIKKMTGLCVLADTIGLYPDAPAAKVALKFISHYLGLELDFARLEAAVQATHQMLKDFLSSPEVQNPESKGLP
jgi:uncharacterized protein (TIGR00162 family)